MIPEMDKSAVADFTVELFRTLDYVHRERLAHSGLDSGWTSHFLFVVEDRHARADVCIINHSQRRDRDLIEAPLPVARRIDQTDLFPHVLQTVDEREESARTSSQAYSTEYSKQNTTGYAKRDSNESKTPTKYSKRDTNEIFNTSTDTIFKPRQGQDIRHIMELMNDTRNNLHRGCYSLAELDREKQRFLAAGRTAGVETWIHHVLKRKGLSSRNIMGRMYLHVRQFIRDSHLVRNRVWFVIIAIPGANFLHGYGTSHAPRNQVAPSQRTTRPQDQWQRMSLGGVRTSAARLY